MRADHDDANASPHDHPDADVQDDHGTMVLTGPGMRSSMTFVPAGRSAGGVGDGVLHPRAL